MTRWYACPEPDCHEVVMWLGHVRYAIGLTDLEPRWMCAACLERLRAAEASYSAGYAFAAADCVWAISVLAEKGQRLAVGSA